MTKKQTKKHLDSKKATTGIALLLIVVTLATALFMYVNREIDKDLIACINTRNMGTLCDFEKSPVIGKCSDNFYKILTVRPSQDVNHSYIRAVTENVYGTIDYDDRIYKRNIIGDCDIYDLKKEMISLRREMYELTKGK